MILPGLSGNKQFKAIIVKMLFVCVISTLCSLHCTTGEINKKEIEIKNPCWNELARFVAGMPVSPHSKFHTISKSKLYETHVHYMKKFWSSIRYNIIGKIRDWRSRHMENDFEDATVFYPLCGADFIYLHSMFPNDTDYLMVAMEPEGNVRALRTRTPAQCLAGLGKIRRVTMVYGFLNYFTSLIMKQELHNYYLTGTTPVLLAFLARMGFSIVDVEAVGLTEKGTLSVLSEAGTLAGRRPRYKGTRIFFTDKDKSTVRTVVYLRMQLNKYTISKGTASGRFLNGFTTFKTMLKSAIYLMHFRRFKEVKEFVVSKSVMVVQDDSGVPFREFNNMNWVVHTYGKYNPVRVVGGTKVFLQRDLANHYKNGSGDLPFFYGYGSLVRPHRSNLQVAIRISDDNNSLIVKKKPKTISVLY